MPFTHNSIKTYTNPVYKRDFPDPGVLRTDTGLYTYATQSKTPDGMHNIQVAFSQDGIHWEARGDALPVKSSWAVKGQDYWAPHVIVKDGTYYMFYNAKKDYSGHAISVATSQSPEGPFVDNGQPLVTGRKFVNIDAFIFHDAEQQRWWLCWGSCHKPIKLRELDSSLLKFAAGSRVIELLAAEEDHPFARLHEASWIHKRFDATLQKTFYYLFTSGADAFGLDSYGLMVARSETLAGPYETLAQAKGLPDSVILRSNATFLNPGAHSIFTDDAGQDWLLYHAYNRADVQVNYKKIHSFPRMMMLDALHYDETGWPCVETGSPSVGLQKGPTFLNEDKQVGETAYLGAIGK
jgi:arabinan endo-1,5-alpha-L-arabinosidase